MKFLSAAVFALSFPYASGLTAEEIGCDGDGPAIGEAISTLEEAGFQAAIQTLIIDPEIPISITNNANYRLRIVAPGELSFNAFLMRAEFTQPEIDSVVLNPDFSLTPTTENAMSSPACIGNILGLVNVDTEPKEEVEGRFRLDEIGNFFLDLTVAVTDEAGNDNIYYSQYNLTSTEVLPDIPTVTPRLLTTSPAPTVTPVVNGTNSSMPDPTTVEEGAPTTTVDTTTTTTGSTPVDTMTDTSSGGTSSGTGTVGEPAAPVDTDTQSQSPAMFSKMVISAAMMLGVALL